MPRSRATLLAVLLCAVPFSLVAQTDQQQGPRPPGWVPPGIEALGQRATFHTNFTLDPAMLRFAGNFMDEDADTQRAVNKLNAISVYSFHYSAPGLYDPVTLASIRAQYDATGWKHMVTAHPKGDPFSASQTDLWISFAHMDVTGMAVLVASARDIDLIAITGDLSPLDLLHLRGHFGIPKFDSDNMVSTPGSGPGSAPGSGSGPAPGSGQESGRQPSEETQPAPPPPPPQP